MYDETVKNQRFPHCSSPVEMQRRYNAVRTAMNIEEIDCLILFNYDNFLGGYTRYFTDFPIGNYPTYMLFYSKDDMVVLGHGGSKNSSLPPFAVLPGMRAPAVPFMPTLHYTNDYAARYLAEDIKKHTVKKAGFVGFSMIPASLYTYLREVLPSVEFVDGTDLVDRIKAIKSPEEIAGLREAVRLHDCIASSMPAFFRPGVYEYEIVNNLKKVSLDLKCEALNIGLGTDPIKPMLLPAVSAYRQVQPGDHLICLIEVSGPGGYYGEICRIWVLGEPSENIKKAFEASVECQKMIASRIKPSVSPGDLFRANNDFLTARGYLPEERLFAHGQGFDMVERPAFLPSETMKLEENMFLALHPTAVNDNAFAFCCDNYLVTATGCERITKTPMEIIQC
jgi:Xaa-Pro aminopeptidase